MLLSLTSPLLLFPTPIYSTEFPCMFIRHVSLSTFYSFPEQSVHKLFVFDFNAFKVFTTPTFPRTSFLKKHRTKGLCSTLHFPHFLYRNTFCAIHFHLCSHTSPSFFRYLFSCNLSISFFPLV